MFYRSMAYVSALVLLVLPMSVEGAGKKKPKPDNPSAPVFSTPDPMKKVVIKPVGTMPFQLPNGHSVDLAVDLKSMLETAVTQTENLRPTDPGTQDPCDNRLELRAAVTALELNVAGLDVSFGYSGGKEKSTVSSLTGHAKVNIGTISMDFGLWDCTGTDCTEIAATRASHLTAGVTLSVEIDFGAVTTGPSLVVNSPMGPILSKVMSDGMKRLSTSAHQAALGWRATVKRYVPEVGLVVFDAGKRSLIKPFQTFEIYAVTEASGFCKVYDTIAYIHTEQVDTLSSEALVDTLLSSEQQIKEGDVVAVRVAN